MGFVRRGCPEHPNAGLALLLSNGEDAEKQMHVGKEHAGEIWKDALQACPDEITIDSEGNGHFRVPAGKAAVFIRY